MTFKVIGRRKNPEGFRKDATTYLGKGIRAHCEVTKSWYQELSVVAHIFWKLETANDVKDGLSLLVEHLLTEWKWFLESSGVLHNMAPFTNSRHITAFLPRRGSEFLFSHPCLLEPLQCSRTEESLQSRRHGLTFAISSALQRSLTIQAISPWLDQFRETAGFISGTQTIFPGQSLAAVHLIYAQKFSCPPPPVCTTRQEGVILPW